MTSISLRLSKLIIQKRTKMKMLIMI